MTSAQGASPKADDSIDKLREFDSDKGCPTVHKTSYMNDPEVYVSGSINGLQPGPHAFHIHEIGSTDGKYHSKRGGQKECP